MSTSADMRRTAASASGIVGIDLGTTFSVLAVPGRVALHAEYGDGVYLDAFDVTVIPTPEGEATFPSAMALGDAPGSYVFGRDALASTEAGQAPIAFAKRRIGTTETLVLGAERHSARGVAAALLRYLKGCAERALGCAVERAVITHPAHFDRAAVAETRAAAVDAGFDMRRSEQMLMEPVAAALAYVHSDARPARSILTYDLGGGTFDVTCLLRADHLIEVKGFAGNNLLGGYNFDRALANWLIERVRARGRDLVLSDDDAPGRAALARLLALAERIKIELAEAPGDDVAVRVRGRGVLTDTAGREVPIDERITRREFTALIAPYLAQTLEHCRAAVATAKLDAPLDTVLLVGGSSRGPWVAEAVRAAFPDADCCLFEPDLCVAAGAALHARNVLPERRAHGTVTLEVDAPWRTAMPLIDVRVRCTGTPVPHTAALCTDGAGGEIEQRDVADGEVTFTEVTLDQGNNAFVIVARDAAGGELARHTFTVELAEDHLEDTVRAVLPRALAIETVDGLIAIADAGAALPVRCSRRFVRQNDNPTITLRLFQDHVHIGSVRIEEIPPAAGAGAAVELDVDVLDGGEIAGTTRVCNPSGTVIVERPVRIEISPTSVPALDALRTRLEQVDRRWAEVIGAGDGRSDRLTPLVRDRYALLHRLFAEVPVDRQEIAAELAALERIVDPPVDDMRPGLDEFLSVVRRTRGAIADVAATRRETLERELDNLYQRGLEAHARRDRRGWGSVVGHVMSLEASCRAPSASGAPTLSTAVTKLIATQHIERMITALNAAAESLRADGRLGDWLSEVRRIFTALDAVREKIGAITDDTSAERALALYRALDSSTLRPLQRAIDNVGIDIGATRVVTGERAAIRSAAAPTAPSERAGITASLLAAGHENILEAVLAETDPGLLEQRDDEGHTPLMVAIWLGNARAVDALLGRGADLDARNQLGRTPLMFARNLAMVRRLAAAGANLEVRDTEDVTPLLLFANQGMADCVAFLLDAGVDREARWRAGQTALATAAINDHATTVELLLARGASVETRCQLGRTPLHHAATAGHAAIVALLLAHGADVDALDEGSLPALYLAAEAGRAACVTALLDGGADARLRRPLDKGTPLMIAAWNGHHDVVEQLLQRGADVEATDWEGDTALMNAAYHGHVAVMEVLCRGAAALDTRNQRGATALCIAAAAGSEETVRWLLAHGADPAITDGDGRSALDQARARGHTAVIALFGTTPH